MQEIHVELGKRRYAIQVGVNLFDHNPALSELAQGRSVALVTDQVVGPLHAGPLMRLLRASAHQVIQVTVPAGEGTKDWLNLNLIFDELLTHRFDRKSLIVALGGGVVGDLAGFAAAVYQRGIDFVQVPTTLLAQVDSSVGGKTAINHPAGKNMIGAFHQPRLVIADLNTLQTLPPRELSAGIGEIIKHGAALNAEYFAEIETTVRALRAIDIRAMASAILGSIAAKAAVVARDEREEGARALLNFGHTFGHAIEAGVGYGEWLHGEGVGVGMVMAAELSTQMGLLGTDQRERLESLVGEAGLPVKGPGWSTERYLSLMSVDKKARQGIPRFVVLERIGSAIVRDAHPDLIDRAIQSHVAHAA